MTRILIHGALGRMGKNVFSATLNDSDTVAVCGVDRFEDFSNPNFPVYDSFEKVSQKVDVIIDFSHCSTLDSVLAFALKTKTPAVLCSTGYTESDIEKINNASKEVALFRSANMSLGINVLLELVKNTAKALLGYDVEIIEKHHNQKVDAPSGTALMLADAVKQADNEKFYTYGREGQVGKRKEKEIGIHAIRGGNIVGEHDVIFAGQDETITIHHQITDRKVFAQGAITAGKYISTKKCGLYNMTDVINQK